MTEVGGEIVRCTFLGGERVEVLDLEHKVNYSVVKILLLGHISKREIQSCDHMFIPIAVFCFSAKTVA